MKLLETRPVVVQHVDPVAIFVELFASDVITIGVVPRLSVADRAVAFVVPGIPIVFRRRTPHHVSHFLGGPTHARSLTHLHMSGSLRRRNIHRSSTYDYLRIKAVYLDAVNPFLGLRPNRHVRRVDLDFIFGILIDCVRNDALTDLDLNLMGLESCDLYLCAVPDAKNVGVVELHFRLCMISGRDSVATDQGLVQRRG
jgi:hypothetical protein